MRGADVRKAREEVHLSQFRAARLLGVTSSELSAIELGKTAPSVEFEAELHRVLSTWAMRHNGGRPAKRSPGTRTGRDRTPASPALVTDCCGDVPEQEPNRRPRAISLFSGCGGFAKGFEAGGFHVAGFSESSPEARATFKRNFPEARCLAHDVHDVSADAIAAALDGRPLIALIAGPPCQGFSLAGKRQADDPRNELFREVVRLAEETKPQFLIIENVRLLSSMRSNVGTLVIDELRKLGGRWLSLHGSICECAGLRSPTVP